MDNKDNTNTDNDQLEFDMTAFGEDIEFDFSDTISVSNDNNDNDNNNDDGASNSDNKSSDPKKEESVADNDKDKSGGNGSDDGGSDDPSQKIYSSLASALTEEGIISSPENPITDPQSLFDHIKKEIEKNEYSDLTDTQKEYLEALRNGIPAEEFKQVKNFEQQLSSINEDSLADDLELRKTLIMQDLINQGVDQAKAEKLTQRSIDLNEDLNDAKEALESVKKFTKDSFQAKIEAQKQANIDLEKKQLDEIKKLKNKVLETNEIIPSVKINEKQKLEIYDSMTKIVGKDKSGRPLNAVMKYRDENKEDFTIKMHYLFHLTNGFKNFDKLIANTKSKAVKDLDDTLKANSFIPSGQQARNNPDYEIDDNMKVVLNNLDI